MQLVCVQWWDANYSHEVASFTQACEIKPALTETVGWLLTQDDKLTRIASERFIDDNTFRDIIAIPAACIVSTTCLRSRK